MTSADVLPLFFAPADVLEVRGVDVGRPGRVVAGYLRGGCPTKVLAGHLAREFGDRASGVYFTPHGRTSHVHVGLAAAWVNARPHTTDADVPARRFLLIDCDPVKPKAAKHASAANAEKAAARLLSDRVIDTLNGLGWADPLRVDSGNGYHLYYRLAAVQPGGPVVDPLADPLAVLLRLLAANLNTAGATVDTTVYNAARIMKLPGTLARKGTPTADRPHRPCVVLSVPPDWPIGGGTDPAADVGGAIELLDPNGTIRAGWRTHTTHTIAGKTKENQGPAGQNGTHTGYTNGGDNNRVMDRAAAYLRSPNLPASVQGQGGSGRALYAAQAMTHGFELSAGVALGLLLQHFNPRCVPEWSVAELERKVDESIKKPLATKPRGWLLADTANDLPPAPLYLPVDVGQPLTDAPKPDEQPTAIVPLTHDRLAANGANEAGNDSMRLARLALARHQRAGRRGLVYWREEFHDYQVGGYVRQERDDFNAGLNAALQYYALQENIAAAEAARKAGEDVPLKLNITTPIVTSVRAAMAGACRVPGLKDAPAWLGEADGRPDPRQVVSVANGLVDFPRYAAGHADSISPHTPDYFAPPGVPYRVDRAAAVPERWLQFLHETWPDDPASIALLQEWFGYLLTADTSRQKMLMLIGRSGGGKGTTLKVMEALLGEDNVASPNVHDFDQDGLHMLIGKPVAVVADAQSGGLGMYAGVIVQNLLKISGEDPVTVRRKYLNAIKVKLPCRMVFAANEVIRLPNTAGAFARRWTVLRYTVEVSVPDQTLGKQLTTPDALAGIFNWAAEGWARLQQQGAFTVTADGAEVVADLVRSGSSVAEFVAERCVEGDHLKVPTTTLYEAWKAWRKGCDQKPGTMAQFGRDLAAYRPKSKPKLRRVDGRQVYHYLGLDLVKTDPYGSAIDDRLAHERASQGQPAGQLVGVDEDL